MPRNTGPSAGLRAGTIEADRHPEERAPTASEATRAEALRRVLPRGSSALEIGARHGYFSLLLRSYFEHVTALDLEKLPWEMAGVTFVAGDVRRLEFPDRSFDCVISTEVLEHVDDLEKAASEIERVARHHVVVSVPFKEDRRINRTLCASCGRMNPGYGHLHSFDQVRLGNLFSGLTVEEWVFAGQTRAATTAVSTILMHWAGYPWGPYDQAEPCIYCGRRLVRPPKYSLLARLAAAAALRIDRVAAMLKKPRPAWVYARFTRY